MDTSHFICWYIVTNWQVITDDHGNCNLLWLTHHHQHLSCTLHMSCCYIHLIIQCCFLVNLTGALLPLSRPSDFGWRTSNSWTIPGIWTWITGMKHWSVTWSSVPLVASFWNRRQTTKEAAASIISMKFLLQFKHSIISPP